MEKAVVVKGGSLLVLLGLLALQGCASAPHSGWGGEVTLKPGWERFKRSALRAASDPGSWMPATAAVLVLATGRDGEWTAQAMENKCVYGSLSGACERSEQHRKWLDQLWIASMLVTDSGDEAWLSNKVGGVVAETLIVNSSIVLTNTLKGAITRRQPQTAKINYNGFPSNHAVPPFTQAALIRRNMDYVPLNDAARYSVITGSYLLAASSAYSRVEIGLHHFSDQFAGAALGNFLGLLLYDTFVEEQKRWHFSIAPSADAQGYQAQFLYDF